MKILAIPRDPNPYQDLLYTEMERRGAEVSYLGELTPSHTLNLLLLPFETAVRRLRGAEIIHLHWVFGFRLPFSDKCPVLRRLAEAWFTGWLALSRLLRLRIVWTAHNVLPHEQVFKNDIPMRRTLLSFCALVIAHSPWTLQGLGAIGASPRRSVIVRHGPFPPPPPPAAPAPASAASAPSAPAPSALNGAIDGAIAHPKGGLSARGTSGGARRFLFFGRVQEYKGVEELLIAFRALGDALGEGGCQLTVAGQCDDPALARRLEALAQGSGVTLRLEHVPEEQVPDLFAGATAVVLPFRQVTTSGSAILALSHGRPLIIPDLPALRDLPDAAVHRYDGTVPGLTGALAAIAQAPAAALAAMSAAATDWAAATTWSDAATATLAAFRSLLAENEVLRG